MPGNKVLIIGVSAVGKTNFATKLGKKLGRKVTHMDAIIWKPGWEYIGDDASNEKLEALSRKNQWIIEGYIATAGRTGLFNLADTIIYLDYNSFLSTWRYIKRWWTHRKTPRPELPGSPEKFSFKFLWLIFSKGETKNIDRLLEEAKKTERLITLHSPKEADMFLKEISV